MTVSTWSPPGSPLDNARYVTARHMPVLYMTDKNGQATPMGTVLETPRLSDEGTRAYLNAVALSGEGI